MACNSDTGVFFRLEKVDFETVNGVFGWFALKVISFNTSTGQKLLLGPRFWSERGGNFLLSPASAGEVLIIPFLTGQYLLRETTF